MKTRSLSTVIGAGLLASIIGIPLESLAQAPPKGLNVNVLDTPLAVEGEVSVTNLPLPVEDVDQPARQAVSASQFIAFPSGLAAAEEEVLYSVPEGKRLVIEYISARVNTGGADNKRFVILLDLGAGFNTATFITPPPIPSSIGTNVHVFSEAVKLYSAMGADIVVDGTRGPDVNATDSLGIRIWGHLVDTVE